MKNILGKTTALILVMMLIIAGCANNKAKENEEKTLVNTIEFEDKKMSYLHFGNPDGKKLIILPGLSLKSVMLSAEAIESAYQILAKDMDIYLFDHIEIQPENYSIEDMADDTLAAIKKLELEHFSLMGVSMGGMVSQTIALKQPSLVDDLILCSTSANVKDMDQTVIRKWLELATDKKGRELAQSFGEHVYSPGFFEQYKDVILSLGDDVSDLEYANFISSLKAIMDFDVLDRLKDIQCPSLVLGAGKDQTLGVEASYQLAEGLGSELYVYEDYGHAAYDEAPDYLQRISSYLNR
ncbi:MAG: alpha/beta hydrolase [Erysipelotrichaceae bacterium]|nr:alpha/beta hydrolase [Erysipelotrichaceae bacterium]